tara:strand:+ start:335 stop:511 length:177 start_codon:yes stop_codon:yes gene_type:complete
VPKPFVTTARLNVNVSYHEHQNAKEMGARWDKKNRIWYVPPGEDPLDFRKWWPEVLNK